MAKELQLFNMKEEEPNEKYIEELLVEDGDIKLITYGGYVYKEKDLENYMKQKNISKIIGCEKCTGWTAEISNGKFSLYYS